MICWMEVGGWRLEVGWRWCTFGKKADESDEWTQVGLNRQSNGKSMDLEWSHSINLAAFEDPHCQFGNPLEVLWRTTGRRVIFGGRMENFIVPSAPKKRGRFSSLKLDLKSPNGASVFEEIELLHSPGQMVEITKSDCGTVWRRQVRLSADFQVKECGGAISGQGRHCRGWSAPHNLAAVLHHSLARLGPSSSALTTKRTFSRAVFSGTQSLEVKLYLGRTTFGLVRSVVSGVRFLNT